MRRFGVAAVSSTWIRFTLAVDVTIFRPLRRAIGAHDITFLFTKAAPQVTVDPTPQPSGQQQKKRNAVKLGFELYGPVKRCTN